MSGEPFRKVASFDQSVVRPAPGVPAAQPSIDLAADAELVLAAVRRIEAALRSDHAVPLLERLRRPVAELAADVAEARLRAVLDDESGGDRTLDVNALLSRLEARVAAMQAVLAAVPPGREPEAAEAAKASAQEFHQEPEETVPTVSHVVSRLAQTSEDAADGDVWSAAPAGRPPSLAMLEAMVEALTAPVAPAKEERETAAPVPETPEAAAAAESAVADAEEVVQPVAFEIETVFDMETISFEVKDAEPPSEPEPEPEPSAAPGPDAELLTSFARMEAMPYLPPEEIGTAVIFAVRDGSDDGPPAEAGAMHDAAPAAAAEPPGPAAAGVFSLAAAAAAQFQPVVTVAARPLALAVPPQAAPETGRAPDEAIEDAAIEAAAAEAEFLFGPGDAAWEPAASLPGSPPEAAIDEATPPQAAPRRADDMLAPLRALTASETVALFS